MDNNVKERLFLKRIIIMLKHPEKIPLSLISTKYGIMFSIGMLLLPILFFFISYRFIYYLFIFLLVISAIFKFFQYIYLKNKILGQSEIRGKFDEIIKGVFLLPYVLFLSFISVSYGGTIIIIVLTLLLLASSISYRFVIICVILYFFIMGIIKCILYIYSDNKFLKWEERQSETMEIVKRFLLTPLNTFNWLGILGLIVIHYFSVVLFILSVLYIMALIAIDMYDNKDEVTRKLTRVNFYITNRKCDICAQSLKKMHYSKIIAGEHNNQSAYICQYCEKGYSPYLQHSFRTLAEAKEHVAYRIANLSQAFVPDYKLQPISRRDNYINPRYIPVQAIPVFLFDFNNQTLIIQDSSLYDSHYRASTIPDRISLKDIIECKLDIILAESSVNNITEEDYKEALRNQAIARDRKLKRIIGDYQLAGIPVSYNETLNHAIIQASEYDPIYNESLGSNDEIKYKEPGNLYDFIDRKEVSYIKKYHMFYIRLQINHKYFSTIDIQLNARPLYFNESHEYYDSYQSIGQEICKHINDHRLT